MVLKRGSQCSPNGVLAWELHARNGVSVLEHVGIPSGPVCLCLIENHVTKFRKNLMFLIGDHLIKYRNPLRVTLQGPHTRL